MKKIAILLAAVALSGCVQQIKESRVKSALMDGGLSEQMSGCMAHRMASKLTIRQLRKLQELSAPERTLVDYLDALRRVDNVEALGVTASSAALCKTGLIR